MSPRVVVLVPLYESVTEPPEISMAGQPVLLAHAPKLNDGTVTGPPPGEEDQLGLDCGYHLHRCVANSYNRPLRDDLPGCSPSARWCHNSRRVVLRGD